jgi:RNA polymerase sigma factor (sigma-70 family)
LPILTHTYVHASAPSGLFAKQSDAELLALFRDGSDPAFEALATRYRTQLQRYCWSMLRSNESTEDAVQDVLVSAFRGLRSDDRVIAVRPWLYAVAQNRCLNELRRASKVRFEPLDEEHLHNAPTAYETVSRRERLRDLVDDVHALPEKQCAALVLREFNGYAYKRIATAIDTTVPGVKSLLVRARSGLRASSALRDSSIA